MARVLVGERDEVVVDSGRRYTEGRPVEVRIRKRQHRFDIDDDGRAVRLAGKPPGWLPVAERVVEEFSLNVNRRGVVFVGTVYPDWVDRLASRIGEASLAVYEALLELEER
jgi:hypothetical protein